jgi:hypothetical protein
MEVPSPPASFAPAAGPTAIPAGPGTQGFRSGLAVAAEILSSVPSHRRYVTGGHRLPPRRPRCCRLADNILPRGPDRDIPARCSGRQPALAMPSEGTPSEGMPSEGMPSEGMPSESSAAVAGSPLPRPLCRGPPRHKCRRGSSAASRRPQQSAPAPISSFPAGPGAVVQGGWCRAGGAGRVAQGWWCRAVVQGWWRRAVVQAVAQGGGSGVVAQPMTPGHASRAGANRSRPPQAEAGRRKPKQAVASRSGPKLAGVIARAAAHVPARTSRPVSQPNVAIWRARTPHLSPCPICRSARETPGVQRIMSIQLAITRI